MKKLISSVFFLFATICFMANAETKEPTSLNEEVAVVQYDPYKGSLGSYYVNRKSAPSVVVSISKPSETVIGVTGPYASPSWKMSLDGKYVEVTYNTGKLIEADNDRVEIAVSGGYYLATLIYTD